jgi:class 3 adenylate cyclase
MDCTILFADVCGSTRLYERLGDEEAQIVIAKALEALTGVTAEHGGTVIKSIGDEVMCTFPQPAAAVEAAQAMNRALDAGIQGASGTQTVNIHVGLHHGPVVEEGGDVYGDAVNLAARMVQLAKPRQILTTEETINLLEEGAGPKTRWVDKTTVKGKTEQTNVHELIWEREAVTMMADVREVRQAITARLDLRLGDRDVTVNIVNPAVTMGRQAHNDLVVDRHQTSRSHARVECRRGKFVLIDQSSNGTYVFPEGKDPIHLTRDETYLSGRGVIGLGFAVEDDSPDAIQYEVSE